MARVIPTYDHTLPYMNFYGPITTRYGRGVVEKGRRTTAEVYHADPDDESGTKLRFNLYEGPNPEEFSIRKDNRGSWFIHNKTQSRKLRPDLPDFKPSYKEISVDKIDPGNEQQALMPKLDGAHVILDLKAGRSPRVFSYREGKLAPTQLIEHTHKMPELLTKKVPKELHNTLLRAEALGIDEKGEAIPAERLSGLLNAKVWESRRKQSELGVTIKPFPFDVITHKGKPLENAPFSEKLKVLDEVGKALAGLDLPEIASTPEEKISLLNRVRLGKHPLTDEGYVLVDKDKASTPIKAKFNPDYDVYVRKIHAAISSKTGEPHERAGAFSYSWTPDGPIVGTVGGFKHEEAKDMLQNPDSYVGRVAKVTARKVFKDEEGDPKSMFQPRFKEWHLDKGDIEKGAMEKVAPYKSLAQQRAVWAKKRRQMQEQEEQEKLTRLKGPEFMKEADISDWVSSHPLAVGLGAAGLGAGGVIAKRLLTKAAPATGMLSRLRPLAKKEGISVFIPASQTKKRAPTLLSKLKGKIMTGGAVKPVYTDAYGAPLKQKGFPRAGVRAKGVTVGAEPTYTRSSAELELGGLPIGKETERVQRAHKRLARAGKVMEGSKEMGIQRKMAPGASLEEIVKKHGLKPPPKGATLEQKADYLSALQKVIKKERRKTGFFAKPHDIAGQAGAFPSEKGDWGKIYKEYHTRLKPQISKMEADIAKSPGAVPAEHQIRKAFSEDPAYVGYALDPFLKQPGKTRIEAKLPIVKSLGKPVEYRVHGIGGEAPAELSYHRYLNFPGARRLLRSKRLGSSDEAARWAQEKVLSKLPKDVRKGSFAMDVVRVKKPGGGYDYKLIELNPISEEGGITSGFMDPYINPLSPYRIHHWIHGKEAPILTGLKAVGAGGAAGTGAGFAAHKLKKKE